MNQPLKQKLNNLLRYFTLKSKGTILLWAIFSSAIFHAQIFYKSNVIIAGEENIYLSEKDSTAFESNTNVAKIHITNGVKLFGFSEDKNIQIVEVSTPQIAQTEHKLEEVQKIEPPKKKEKIIKFHSKKQVVFWNAKTNEEFFKNSFTGNNYSGVLNYNSFKSYFANDFVESICLHAFFYFSKELIIFPEEALQSSVLNSFKTRPPPEVFAV